MTLWSTLASQGRRPTSTCHNSLQKHKRKWGEGFRYAGRQQLPEAARCVPVIKNTRLGIALHSIAPRSGDLPELKTLTLIQLGPGKLH